MELSNDLRVSNIFCYLSPLFEICYAFKSKCRVFTVHERLKNVGRIQKKNPNIEMKCRMQTLRTVSLPLMN